MIVLTVESRIVAYSDDMNALPHVFASVSVPVTLSVLDNSQKTLDTVSAAVSENTQQLDELFEKTLVEDRPKDFGDTLIANELDANALRMLLAAIDQGKVRILASHTSLRQSKDPLWYCVKLKKVAE